jgi:hypothetical protein
MVVRLMEATAVYSIGQSIPVLPVPAEATRLEMLETLDAVHTAAERHEFDNPYNVVLSCKRLRGQGVRKHSQVGRLAAVAERGLVAVGDEFSGNYMKKMCVPVDQDADDDGGFNK